MSSKVEESTWRKSIMDQHEGLRQLARRCTGRWIRAMKNAHESLSAESPDS